MSTCATCTHWDEPHCTNAAHRNGPFKPYIDALHLKIGDAVFTTGRDFSCGQHDPKTQNTRRDYQ